MFKYIMAAVALSTVSAISVKYNDLPYDADKVEKLDTLSRYVNDADIVQLHDNVKLAQLQYNDLPYDADKVEKLDGLSRYVNDADIWRIKKTEPIRNEW